MACPGCMGQTKVICILNYPNKLFTCCVLFGFPIFQYDGMVYIFFRRTLALRNILQALAEIEYNGYFLLICAMVDFIFILLGVEVVICPLGFTTREYQTEQEDETVLPL